MYSIGLDWLLLAPGIFFLILGVIFSKKNFKVMICLLLMATRHFLVAFTSELPVTLIRQGVAMGQIGAVMTVINIIGMIPWLIGFALILLMLWKRL